MTKINKKNSPILLAYFGIIAVGTIVFFCLLSLSLDIPLKLLFNKLVNSFYRPNQNIIRVGSIAGVNIYVYLYSLIIIFLITLPLTNFIIKRIGRFKHRPTLAAIVFLIIGTFYFFIIGLQTWNITNHFHRELLYNAGHPIKIKYTSSWDPYSYHFAKYCRSLLPGAHSAKLITDLDVSADPGMLIHRKFSYFLYPIDVRNIRKEPPDNLIIFAKQNAVEAVPDDFRILGIYNEHNVIAVRKDSNFK